MAEHQTEGGTEAYCPECQQGGHYQTAHHTAEPRWP